MTLPTLSPRLSALRSKLQSNRGRLIFALDATASREPAWDLAAKLTSSMFEEAAKIGALDLQLVSFRGNDEVQKTDWFSDAGSMILEMSKIRCRAGATNIKSIIEHIRGEHIRERVGAAIFIGDAVEEFPKKLYAAAADLNVPVFMFQEGNGAVAYLNEHGELASEHPPQKVEQVFREIARLTGGAFCRFDAGAAKQLGELLRAVAAFAVGGVAALADQRTDAARKLLGQMK